MQGQTQDHGIPHTWCCSCIGIIGVDAGVEVSMLGKSPYWNRSSGRAEMSKFSIWLLIDLTI